MKKLKGLCFLFVVLIGTFSCMPPKYFAEKYSNIVKLDLENSITNYIPIADEDLNRSNILLSAYGLITSRKYSKLDSYLTSLEKKGTTSSDLYLSKTLLLISKQEYSNAMGSLRKVADSDFPLLKKLLLIDLNYEISRLDGSFDYNMLLKKYQDLIDAYPNDIPLKKIVNIRLRYLRYNY